MLPHSLTGGTAGSTPIQIEETPIEVPTEEFVSIYCSCVQTVRAEGVTIPIGTNASDFIPNTTLAESGVGSLIIFEYTTTYHVAYIVEFRADVMLVVEGNKTPCEREYRLVSYNDPFIKGFWKP